MKNKFIQMPMVALSIPLLLLTACVSSQPVNPDAKTDARKAAESNTQLGLEYMARGQHEVALGKLKKAVRDDPAYAPGHTVLAVLYETIGELELAGKQYKEAFEADPEGGDVNNNYGTYLCKTGDSEAAIGHFLKALDDPFYSSPKVALANAGSCALTKGLYQDADKYLRAALKYDPGFPDALLSMVSLSYQQKNYLKARAFLQRYESVAKQTSESVLLGYEVETAMGNDTTARQYLSLLNNEFPDSEEAEEARGISRP